MKLADSLNKKQNCVVGTSAFVLNAHSLLSFFIYILLYHFTQWLLYHFTQWNTKVSDTGSRLKRG